MLKTRAERLFVAVLMLGLLLFIGSGGYLYITSDTIHNKDFLLWCIIHAFLAFYLLVGVSRRPKTSKAKFNPALRTQA